jgi:hypothetical protein
MGLIVVLLLPLYIAAFSQVCFAKLGPDNAGSRLSRIHKAIVAKPLTKSLLDVFATVGAIDFTGPFQCQCFVDTRIDFGTNFFIEVEIVMNSAIHGSLHFS